MVHTLTTPSRRQRQIVSQYRAELDKHLNDILEGTVDRMFEIRDFADLLHIHPRHLSNTVNEVCGRSACSIFEEKLLKIASELLLDSHIPVAEVARKLTFDPSNFTKFFKRFTGLTPRQFRERHFTA